MPKPPRARRAAVGDPAYERGYSLDRLRELTLTELVTPRGRSGTHLYESLHVLFGLVDRGHDGSGDDPAAAEGLTFRSLRADLFKPEATALIDETKLGNAALQQVFRHLLLLRRSEAATAASSPTRSWASTSSARCTRA